MFGLTQSAIKCKTRRGCNLGERSGIYLDFAPKILSKDYKKKRMLINLSKQ